MGKDTQALRNIQCVGQDLLTKQVFFIEFVTQNIEQDPRRLHQLCIRKIIHFMTSPGINNHHHQHPDKQGHRQECKQQAVTNGKTHFGLSTTYPTPRTVRISSRPSFLRK